MSNSNDDGEYARSEYIGSVIYLISTNDIRYRGTLHSINSVEHTVSLKNVYSFGTEGRRNGVGEIPAMTEMFEFIVFRGSDVKELTIEDNSAPAESTSSIPDDPAILHAKTFNSQASRSRKPAEPMLMVGDHTSHHQLYNHGALTSHYTQPHQAVPPSNTIPMVNMQRPVQLGTQYTMNELKSIGQATSRLGGQSTGLGGASQLGPSEVMGGSANEGGMFYGLTGSGMYSRPASVWPINNDNNINTRVSGNNDASIFQSPPCIGVKANMSGSGSNVYHQQNGLAGPPGHLPLGAPGPLSFSTSSADMGGGETVDRDGRSYTAGNQKSKVTKEVVDVKSEKKSGIDATYSTKGEISNGHDKVSDVRDSVGISGVKVQGSNARIALPEPGKTKDAVASMAQKYLNANRAATAAVAAAMAKLSPQVGRKEFGGGVGRGIGTGGIKRDYNSGHTNNRGGGGGGSAGQMEQNVRDRRSGATFGVSSGISRGHFGGQNRTVVPKADFDFESANKKFNKLNISKEIENGSNEGDVGNGNVTSRCMDARGMGSPKVTAETRVRSDGEDQDGDSDSGSGKREDEPPTIGVAYNKGQSFFDNISSDLRDRAENKERRGNPGEFRKEERRKNMETFGQGSVDSFRFRGRGRGRGGRGRGGGGGGGSGYRGGRQ